MHLAHQHPIEPSNPGPSAHGAGRGLIAGQPARSNASGSPSLSFAALLQSFRTRWLLAASVGLLLGGAAAAVVWQRILPKYQASALVRVLASEPKIMGGEDRSSSPEKTSYQKTQIAMLTSRPVLEAAVNSERARALGPIQTEPDAAAWLGSQLRVGFIEDSDLLRISLMSEDANAAEILVNAVLDAYLQSVERSDVKEQTDRLADLRKSIGQLQDTIRTEKEELSKLATTLKTMDPQALTLKQKNALDDHASYRREMALVLGQIRATDFKHKLLRLQIDTDGKAVVSAAMLDQAAEADPKIQQQKAEVARLTKVFGVYKQGGYADSVPYARAEKELREAKSELDQMLEERRATLAALLRQRIDSETRSQAMRVKEEAALLKEQYAIMLKEEKLLRDEAEKIGTNSYVLEDKRFEIDQLVGIVKSLNSEVIRRQMELESNKRRVTRVHGADVPRAKIATARIQGSVFAGLGAFLAGVAGVSYFEFKKRKIQTTDEVTLLDVKVLGTLPAVPRLALAGPVQEVGAAPNAQFFAEAVSYVRTMLLNTASREGGHKVIMVGSAESGEGKTMLAGHLAINIAEAGHKVLVIDGDLRRASLSRHFGAEAAPGLCEVLRDELDAGAAVVPSGVTGLSLLPVGNCTQDVLQRLSQRGLGAVLDRLRAEYEFVIIDSSPLMAVSDALHFARLTDGVVLCIRPGVSNFPSVGVVRERLQSLHIPILGVVINGMRHSPSSSAYRYLSLTPSLTVQATGVDK